MRVNLSPQFKANLVKMASNGLFTYTQPVYIAGTRSLAFIPITTLLNIGSADIPTVKAKVANYSPVILPVFQSTELLAQAIIRFGKNNAQEVATLLRQGQYPAYEGSASINSPQYQSLEKLAGYFNDGIIEISKSNMLIFEDTAQYMPLYPNLWSLVQAEKLPRYFGSLAYGLTHIGDGKRDNNEDYYIINNNTFILCDGIGGHAKGEVASEMAARIVYYCLQNGLTLKQAIFLANQQIHKFNRTGNFNSGTTIVAVQIDSNVVKFAHVGDSRLYLFKKDGTRQQLTQDHGFTGHIITRAIGSANAEPDIGHQILEPDDTLLLCSDGLSDPLDETTIANIVTQGKSSKQTSKALLNAALATGKAHDNITFILYQYGKKSLAWRLLQKLP